ncbi:AfsR/SARP family transcriptional regulator [Actinomycetota bacterium Odt1-20B]
MEIHILGPVGLHTPEGRLGLGSDKERMLIAALALAVGRPIALDTLADHLWDSHPPSRPRDNIHTYVSRIRRAMRTAVDGGPLPVITHRAHTYTLEAEPDDVDWHRYQRLYDRARAVAGEDEGPRAIELMTEAESLWTGEPLAGLAGLWPEQMRTGLSEKRRGLLSARIGLYLRLGQYPEITGELTLLVDQHPADETLVSQLMTAHYGSGRHADALRVYQDARRTLRTHYGTEPGEELVRVHRHILARGPVRDLTGSAGPEPPRRTELRPPRPAPGHLPRHVRLVGRKEELERIRAAMVTAPENGSVVTLESISGMAGVGKSALAIRAAHDFAALFPDGQLYVNLRSHAQGQKPLTPDTALATLLRLLKIAPQSIPADLDERSALWRTLLADRRVLIVLDDAAGPEQVRPLLPDAPACFTLITSRRRIVGLERGHTLSLDVLPYEQAHELFLASAGLGHDADQEVVGEIVRRCGYLPLAIEIAANRLSAHPSWTPAVLRDRLSGTSGRLGEIRDGYSTIARPFEVSYETLSSAAQTAFRLLSLHSGAEFGVHAAAALCGHTVQEAELLLDALLESHLVEEPLPHRFRFHDLLGEFSRLLCAAKDTDSDRAEAASRLVTYYLRAADRCDRVAYPRRSRLDVNAELAARPGTGTDGSVPLPAPATAQDALAWFDTERPNLLSAEELARRHGLALHAALISHVLAGFLDGECYWADSVRLNETAVAYWRRTTHEGAQCHSLLELGAAHAATGGYERAEALMEQAVRIAHGLREPEAEADGLRELGVLHWHAGRYRRALDFYRRSLPLCTSRSDSWRQARLRNNMAISFLYLGEHDAAMRHFQEAISGFRSSRDQRMLVKTLNNLGNLHQHMGSPELARRTLEYALRIAAHAGSRADRATLSINLAEALAATGQYETARALCEEALPVFRQLGDLKNEAITLTQLGGVHEESGDFPKAAARLLRALALAQDIGASIEETQAGRLLGSVEHRLGNLDAARSHLESARDTARRIQAPVEEARAEDRLAEVHLESGLRDEARELWRHALELIQALDPTAAERIRERLIEVDQLRA